VSFTRLLLISDALGSVELVYNTWTLPERAIFILVLLTYLEDLIPVSIHLVLEDLRLTLKAVLSNNPLF
jgi:hypothetical protein